MSRVNLKDLLPETNYVLRVRAVGPSGKSAWSNRFTFRTIDDTGVPATVSNLTWITVGDSFHGEWDSVSININGHQVNPVRYDVELTWLGGGYPRYVSVVAPGAGQKVIFDLPVTMNRALFGSARSAIGIRVRAVDSKDRKGDWFPATPLFAVNNPPAAPTNVTAEAGIDSIILRWTPAPNNDIVGYNIYHGAQNILVGFVDGNTYTYYTSTYSEQILKVASLDKFDQTSELVAAPAITPISPFIVDLVPPDVPSITSANIVNSADGASAVLNVVWSMGNVPPDLMGYQVRYKKSSDTFWSQQSATKSDSSMAISFVAPYVPYDVQIRAVDDSANYSAWSATTVASAAPNNPPGTVGAMTATPGKDAISYSWTALADTDIRDYEVTISTSSTFASGNVILNNGNSTSITVGGLSPSTTYYARVRARDFGGLYSAAYSPKNTSETTAFPQTPMSDGNPPASSPAATVASKTGYLAVSWLPVSNADPVIYEVHLSTTSNFTPIAGTKCGEVSGTSMDINSLPGTTTPLASGTTYYVRIVAKDRDPGAAAAGTQGSGSPSPDTQEYVQAKGTDYIVNGASTMGTNYNFTGFSLNKSDAPTGAAGSFLSPQGVGGAYFVDELLPVDPAKKLRLSFQGRQTGTSTDARAYMFLYPYDAYKLAIAPSHYMYTANTLTTLAADLVNGATTITLTSSANFYGTPGKNGGASTHLRSIIWWDYVDAGGKLWPELTYSRNFSGSDYWADGGITGNVITLNAPYSGPTRLAGTKLSNGSSGGTYMYGTLANQTPAAGGITTEWTTFAGSIVGTTNTGISAGFNTGWPPGTSFAKVGWLLNRQSGGAADPLSRHAVALVSLSDAAAAQEDIKTSIKSYVNEFYLSTSESTQTGGSWSTTAPTRTPGSFIWTRTLVTYQDNTTSLTPAVLMTGNAGAQGAPATSVDLSATTQALSEPALGGATTPATSVITGTTSGGTTIADANSLTSGWSYSVNGAAFATALPPGLTRTGNQVTITGGTMTAKTIAVKAIAVSGVEDTLTVAKVKDGAAGSAGSNGTDGYTVLLSNESQVYAGSTTAAYANSSVSTTVMAYRGSTLQSASVGTITGGATGITMTTRPATQNTTAPIIDIAVTTALTTPTGTFSIPVTVNGITFTQVFSWSVSFAGSNGSNGTNGTSPTTADLGNDAVAIPVTSAGAARSGGSITIPFSGWVGATRTAATIAAGTLPPGITLGTNTPATSGADGSLVLNYANAATIGSADTSNLDLTITCNSVAILKKFSISRAYSGIDGSAATSIDVSPDVFMVPTNSAGAASATSSATVNFRGFVGSTASNVTALSVTSGLPTGGMTATPTTGASANIVFNWTSGQTIGATASGNIVCSATVNGVVFTVNIGWARAIAGAAGSAGSAGSNGTDGVSITSVTPYFQTKTPIGAAAPGQPTANPPGGSWTTAEPGYVSNTELYRTELIQYSNGTYSYTLVNKASSYTAASQAQSTADGKNKIIRNTAAASGTSGYVNGDLWFQYSGTDLSTGTIIGQWLFEGGTWVPQTIRKEVIGYLNAEKLTTGFLDAARINASTITANKLNVSIGGENLVKNSSFEALPLAARSSNSGVVSQDTAVTPTHGSKVLKYTGSNTANPEIYFTKTAAMADLLPVRENTSYTYSLFARASTALSFQLYTYWYTAAGALIGTGDGVTMGNLPTTSFQRFSRAATAPATAAYLSISLYIPSGAVAGTIVYVDGVMVESGDLMTAYSPKTDEILPGTIKGEYLESNTALINTLKIGAGGTLQSSNFVANTSGYQLSENLLDIRSGVVAANTLVSGTGILNNLVINSGGAIQSSVYNTTTGFKISNTGIEMNDSGSSIKADAIKAGTLGGTSGSGVINIALGTSLIFNGGYLKSSTNTGTTMATAETSGQGFYLGQDGMFIGSGTNGGKIKANALVSDTLTSTNITLGAGGTITAAGWQLNSSGLTIPNGGIQAAAITITSEFGNSATSIDGSVITTGSIQSNALALDQYGNTIAGVPAWILQKTGAAQLGNSLIRGRLTVGFLGDSQANAGIQSANYEPGSVGWRINNLNAEFNSITIRESAIVGGSLTASSFKTSTASNPVDVAGITINWGGTREIIAYNASGNRFYYLHQTGLDMSGNVNFYGGANQTAGVVTFQSSQSTHFRGPVEYYGVNQATVKFNNGFTVTDGDVRLDFGVSTVWLKNAVLSGTNASLTGAGAINISGTITSSVNIKGNSLDATNLEGGAVSANINASGRIVRGGSSLRYKNSIEDMPMAEARAALKLKSVSFIMNEDSQYNIRVVGVIAEQAAEVGMEKWIWRDKQSRPDGFHYDKLAVAHNMIITDHDERIKKLEEEIMWLKASQTPPA